MSALISALSNVTSLRLFGRRARAYDLMAASPLIVWYFVCMAYQWPSLVSDTLTINFTSISPLAAVDLVSRLSRFIFGALLIVLMAIRRTPIKKQQSISRRVIAFFGCYVGIAAQVWPTAVIQSWWLMGSALMIVFGMMFATYSLLWLGRSISVMPESRKLVTSGPYSIIRHPLYFGEQIAIVGIALQCSSLWVMAVLTLQTCCQLYRMSYEEEILTQTFPEYEDYAGKTARIIPWLY